VRRFVSSVSFASHASLTIAAPVQHESIDHHGRGPPRGSCTRGSALVRR